MELLSHLNNILPLRIHILLAVSSGLDSMVLLDILQYTKLYISVVHTNFKLRSSDSNKDEFFIKDFCQKKKFLFTKKGLILKLIVEKKNLYKLLHVIYAMVGFLEF